DASADFTAAMPASPASIRDSMSGASATSTTSSSRAAPTLASPPPRKVTSFKSWSRCRRRGVAPEALADEPRALAHQLQDLLLDLDLFLARAAQCAEEAALRGEHRVGNKGANLEQPCHAAARKLFLRVGRVVRTALDHEPAYALRPRQGDVLGDVEHVASVAGEDDVLLIDHQPGLRKIGRAETGQLGQPGQDASSHRLQVVALPR